MEETFERLRRLTPDDAAKATELGHKCQTNIPETFHAPGTPVCHRPISHVVQQKFGDITNWWYSCEECAETVMKDLGYRV